MNKQVDQSERFGQLARYWLTAHPVLSAFLHGMVSNEHDVEDLIQRVAETCARKFDEFDSDGSAREFRSWALTIARYETLLFYREQGQSAKRFSPETLEFVAKELTVHKETPDERLEAIRQCLGKLKKRDKQLVEMRYYRNLTSDGIAERLAISSNAVRTALHRARRDLAKCVRARIAD